jgi:GAF domain-containing protein
MTKVNDMAEVQLADVFVEMADTLVDDFDLIDFLHILTERCVQLLGVSAAGLLLTDGHDALQVVAASSERTRLLELFQLQTDQGPCLDCFRTGQQVSVVDLASTDRWPDFCAAAAEVGFRAVHALPMRLRNEVIGALNLFDVRAGALDPQKLSVGQALADVATIGLLQQRTIRRSDVLVEQLQTALNTRVLIEQAKGVVAERLHVDVAEAFTLLRSEARRGNRRLSDLAQAIVDGSEQLAPRPPTRLDSSTNRQVS